MNSPKDGQASGSSRTVARRAVPPTGRGAQAGHRGRMPLPYRREIDGLRAVAVLPVILFHAGFGFFSGGYIGVDVFFVISGYLITSIIINEKQEGRFSLIKFYERRARRILPALFFVILFCLPFAFLWLYPSQLRNFGQSVLAISVFASNILFARESGYFDPAAEEKPLLHTWSLAVEEQYYVILPLFLMLAWRLGLRNITILIAATTLFSVGLAEWASLRLPTWNFYLLPTRAWELLIGSLTAIYLNQNPMPRGRFNQLCAAIGLLLIVVPIVSYDDFTPFPGVYALAPTLGTALIILFATPETLVNRLLSLPVLVGVGLISYSAYLWHQPFFVFARIRFPEAVSEGIGLMLAVAALALLFAWFSWRYVELPFRDRKRISRRTIFTAAVATSTFMASLGMAGHLSEGFQKLKLDDEAVAFLRGYGERENTPLFYKQECDFYRATEIAENCLTSPDPRMPTVLVWGDSHAQAIGAGLREQFGDRIFFAQLATSLCKPMLNMRDPATIPEYPTNSDRSYGPACEKASAVATDYVRNGDADAVVFAMQSGHETVDWKGLAEFLSDHGVKQVIVFGPVPQYVHNLPEIYARTGLTEDPADLREYLVSKIIRTDAFLKETLQENQKLIYVSPISFLCRDNTCAFKIPNTEHELLHFDYGHLTIMGSKYIADSLFTDLFTRLLQETTRR